MNGLNAIKGNEPLVIGIDASNIRSGGGLTHLVELLNHSDPIRHDFDKIVVWANKYTLSCIEDKDWIMKESDKVLEYGFIRRLFWQRRMLQSLLGKHQCAALFVPGGSFVVNYNPVITMSQNLLPFNLKEISQYGSSLFKTKLLLLRLAQQRSFRKADGIIFLSKHAKDVVLSTVRKSKASTAIIGHGIDKRFICAPKIQKSISYYDKQNPIVIIYVSSLEPYKHHDNVIKACVGLYNKGVPVLLNMYGASNSLADTARINRVIQLCDPDNKIVRYHGNIKHDQIHSKYQQSDISVFASSCENLPIILLEAMASGLPIVSSDVSPMTDILGEYSVYFDPYSSKSIESALYEMVSSVIKRQEFSIKTHNLALSYSWSKCADETFSFINAVSEKYRKDKSVQR